MINHLKIRGINLVYEDLGKGEVIVFMHGQPFNRSMWKYQADEFSRSHRLIIPDLRGYGETDIIERITLLDELALDIVHLLEELKIEKAIFVGLSMGGQIAFELYRLVPHLFKGLVLADTDARTEDVKGYRNRIRLSNVILSEGMVKFAEERISMFMCKNTFNTKPEIVEHLRKMMMRHINAQIGQRVGQIATAGTRRVAGDGVITHEILLRRFALFSENIWQKEIGPGNVMQTSNRIVNLTPTTRCSIPLCSQSEEQAANIVEGSPD